MAIPLFMILLLTSLSQRYFPGMWATIGMQILYIVITITLSFWFKGQNRKADRDGQVVLEGVKNFRYAP